MSNIEYLTADGFDDAIIGIDMNYERVVYDKHKMCEILVMEGLTYEEAIEFLAYNVWGAYVGDHTPIYIDVMNAEEFRDLLDKEI